MRTESECVGEAWGSPAYQSIHLCPYCGSEDFEPAQECKICGDHFAQEGCEEACEECRGEIVEAFYQILEAIRERSPRTNAGDLLDIMSDAFDEFYNKYEKLKREEE